MYCPQIVRLMPEDREWIRSLAVAQTQAYGHDRGFFTLGRNDSSHEIGFEGEVAFVRWCRTCLGKKVPTEAGLNAIGSEFDAYLVLDGIRYNIHVKTGRWNRWPQSSWFFGVHYGQDIEHSGCPVVLASYLKSDPTFIRIEGFMPSEVLGRQRVIRRGERFPGMSYPSRTDNWLTRFGDYECIATLPRYLKQHTAV